MKLMAQSARAVPANRLRLAQRGERAFTMIEIAISLAVIGFALVAIIGVLPTGMQVGRENREDTIIAYDAKVWLDAVRNGDQPARDGCIPTVRSAARRNRSELARCLRQSF